MRVSDTSFVASATRRPALLKNLAKSPRGPSNFSMKKIFPWLGMALALLFLYSLFYLHVPGLLRGQFRGELKSIPDTQLLLLQGLRAGPDDPPARERLVRKTYEGGQAREQVIYPLQEGELLQRAFFTEEGVFFEVQDIMGKPRTYSYVPGKGLQEWPMAHFPARPASGLSTEYSLKFEEGCGGFLALFCTQYELIRLVDSGATGEPKVLDERLGRFRILGKWFALNAYDSPRRRGRFLAYGLRSGSSNAREAVWLRDLESGRERRLEDQSRLLDARFP